METTPQTGGGDETEPTYSIQRHPSVLAGSVSGDNGRHLPSSGDPRNARDKLPQTGGIPIPTTIGQPEQPFGEQQSGIQLVAAHQGPLAAPWTLSQYDASYPGTGLKLIEAHLRREQVVSDTIERIGKTEARAPMIGAVAAPTIVLASIAALITLVLRGQTTEGLLALLPAVLAILVPTIAQAVNKPKE